jgi:hypothetical protein
MYEYWMYMRFSHGGQRAYCISTCGERRRLGDILEDC